MSGIPQKSLETFALRAISLAFALVSTIVIARALGPAGKGTFAYVVTCSGLILALLGGQSAAVSWEYGRRKREPGAVYAAAMRILLLTAVPVAVILAIVGLSVPAQRPLLALACAVPFMAYAQFVGGFFLADSNVRIANVQTLLPAAMLAVAVLLLLASSRLTVASLLFFWTIAYVAVALYTYWRFRAQWGDRVRGSGPAGLWEQLSFGLRVALNGGMSYLNFRIDVFIVLSILGTSALGIYSVGIAVGELMWQLSRPIATASFGRIGSSGESEAAVLTAKCLRHVLAIAVVAAVVLYFASPFVVPLVYGARFAGAALIVRLLLPGMIAYSAMPILATFFAQQLGRPGIPLLFSTISTLTCAALTLATIAHWNIAGGAFATSVAYIVAFTCACVYFVRRTGIAPRDLLLLKPADVNEYRRFVGYGASYMTRTLGLQR